MSTSLQGMPHAYALDPNALPNGGVVVSGDAQFDYSQPNELHVQQNTDRAVINWNSFNIGENATTQFHQNNSNSIAVNRVIGAGLDPTQIMGTLKANGRVIVLDRNGVIFGPNSQVNVGSIVASTGNIDDAAFMNSGQIKITGADTDGQIVNNGHITVSDAGLAAFVAPTVKNNGMISAKLGKVTLASGDEATVDLYGDGLVELAAGKKLTNALVENTGTINAEGGTVTLTASGAKDIVNTVINTSGIINVSSVTDVGGKIILEGANTEVSGTLDASGHKGGGTILIGGDYKGEGTVKTANKTTVTTTARIKANTTGASGKGGKVIVWSDDSTKFEGKIEAKGGYIYGDGGFVETSGKINLGVLGEVDVSATDGSSGSWLLDPSNVIISGTGGNNVANGTNNPSTDSYQISAASIQTALNSGANVTITTTNGAGTQEGNITTDGTVNINKSSGANSTLTLQAANNIELNDTTIQATGANRLNFSLVADSDNNGSGAITLGNFDLATKNGTVNFNKAVTLTGDNIWNAGTGVVTTGSTVNMGTHNLTINAGNMDVGGNMYGTGSNVLTIRPGTASADISINDGYNFVFDTTESTYLNPGSKLVLGHVGGTGDANIIDWDLTGKSFDLEINSGYLWMENFKQGNGAVKINSRDVTLYGVELGAKDFFVDARKIGGSNGSIYIAQDIVKNAAGTSRLTLKSADRIYGSNIISNNGALDVVIWGDSDNTANDGHFDHQGTISTRGGDINIVGGLDDGANGGVAGDGIGDGYAGLGSILWGANYNAGGGDILIQGNGGPNDHGFNFGNNTVLATNGNGNITIRGVAGNTNSADGVSIGGGTDISAENGTIRIEGTNARARTSGTGVFIGNSNVHTTGTTGGDIYVTGTRSGATGGDSYGIELYESGNEITSKAGNIYITGTSTVTTNGVTSIGVHSWGDTKIASETGDIILTGTATATTGTVKDWKTDGGSTFTVGDASSTGDIILNIDSFEFWNTLDVRTQGTIHIKPRTATMSIGLSGGAGSMNFDNDLAYFNGGTLIFGDSVNGVGDINVNTWDLSAKNYNVLLYGNDINLGGVTLGSKNFEAHAKNNGGDVGDITVSAAITKSVAGASELNLTSGNDITVNSTNNIKSTDGAIDITMEADGKITVTNSTLDGHGGEVNLIADGDVTYTSPDAITVDEVKGDKVLIRTTTAGKDITASGEITATGSGDAAVLSATGNFINDYGADLFDMTGSGRWLVYSTDPSLNTRNGLMPNAVAIYGATYAGTPPASVASGNRFLFSTAASNAPVVNIKAEDATKAAGMSNGGFTFTVDPSGLISGDAASDVYAGTPLFSTTVNNATPEGVYANAVSISAGSLVSYLGYDFTFQNGDFTVTAAPPPPPPSSTDMQPIQNFDAFVASLSTKSAASVNSLSGMDLQYSSSLMLSIQYPSVRDAMDVVVEGDSLIIR